MAQQPSRSCGGCTACCKTHPVLSIEKKLQTWCTHCRIGKGCDIYGQRPADCAAFKCLWLLGFLPEDERPDRSRIVIDSCPSELLGHDTLAIFEVSFGALDSPAALREKKRALVSGCVVTEIKSSGALRMTFPEGYRLSKENGDTLVGERVEVCLYQPG